MLPTTMRFPVRRADCDLYHGGPWLEDLSLRRHWWQLALISLGGITGGVLCALAPLALMGLALLGLSFLFGGLSYLPKLTKVCPQCLEWVGRDAWRCPQCHFTDEHHTRNPANRPEYAPYHAGGRR